MEDPNLWHPWRGLPFIVKKLVLPQLQQLYDLTQNFARQGDAVVVAPCTAVWVPAWRTKSRACRW